MRYFLFFSVFLISLTSSAANDLKILFKKESVVDKKYSAFGVKGGFIGDTPELVGKDRLKISNSSELNLRVDAKKYLPTDDYALELFFRYEGGNGVIFFAGSGQGRYFKGIKLATSDGTMHMTGTFGKKNHYWTARLDLVRESWNHFVVRFDSKKKAIAFFLNGVKVNESVGKIDSLPSFSSSKTSSIGMFPSKNGLGRGQCYYLGMYSKESTFKGLTDAKIAEKSKLFFSKSEEWLIEDQKGAGAFYEPAEETVKTAPEWFSSLVYGVGVVVFLLWGTLWLGVCRRFGVGGLGYIFAFTPIAPIYLGMSRWGIEKEVSDLKKAQPALAGGDVVEGTHSRKMSKSRKTSSGRKSSSGRKTASKRSRR